MLEMDKQTWLPSVYELRVWLDMDKQTAIR
jgi:hypothetical protein